MASADSPPVDYEVTEEGVFYDAPESDEGEESDPLASDDQKDPDRAVQEEVFGANIDDLFAEARGGRRRRKRRSSGAASKRRPNEVPAHLMAVMGAATMAYISQRVEEAESALKRIIEEAPRAVAPYRTLGLIYEERGEKRKALDMFMTAAELDRQDRELWKRVAALWDEEGDPEKAIYCLTQALKGTYGQDADALRGRGMLFMNMSKYRRAADSFVKLAKVAPTDPEVAKLVVFAYRQVGEPSRAAPTVEAMVRACQVAANTARGAERERHREIVSELIEILVELRIIEGRYYDANVLITRLQGLSSNSRQPMTFVQRLMLAICQHRLGSAALALPTFQEFMASPTMRSKHRVLLWQIADATRESGDYKTAANAYSLLLELNDVENRAEMYLQRAVCHKEIGNLPAAKADLENVLSLHPRHVEASLRIQEFLPPRDTEKGSKKRRRIAGVSGAAQISQAAREREEATHALRLGAKLFESGDYSGYLMHMFSALQTALRLDGPRRVDEDDNDDDELEEGSSGEEARQRGTSPSRAVTTRRNPLWSRGKLSRSEKARLHALGASMMRQLADEQFVQVAERILLSFQKVGRPEQAHSLVRTFDSLSHLRVKADRNQRKRLRMLSLVTCIASGDILNAYEHARTVLLEYPADAGSAFAYSTVEQLWGVESDIQRNRSFRYLMRLVKKNPNSACLSFIAGNCSSRGGLNIRRYTVGIYLKALRLSPHHPLICLCLAIQVVYVAMGRRITNRNEMMMYALGFLDDYRRNRRSRATEGEIGWLEMEADYNVGRVMHQLGLLHMAADMYRRVLKFEYEGTENGMPDWADLRRDAAYNLIQIYQGSKNHAVAAAICAEYLQF